MSDREDFEKALQLYASQHATGSVGLVRKIASYFYDARQPEIDAKNKVIDDLALQKGILLSSVGSMGEEIAALKAEVERLRKDAESASLFLLSMSCSASVSPAFRKIAKGHHEALDAATQETK